MLTRMLTLELIEQVYTDYGNSAEARIKRVDIPKHSPRAREIKQREHETCLFHLFKEPHTRDTENL